ncbi:hypothetical protein QOZ80_5AG0400390 [Eleusine coracana subsp. coracana]|nr:hypothetical protein QOZ80_5AG0400390 [Eleusine coracana subsp. coracana]
MAMILDAFVPIVGRMVADAVRAKFDMLVGVPADMQKLETILEDLGNVLVDAERKRITDTVVDGWVRELKDVMYDADDVLDQWMMEARSSHAAKRSSSAAGGCCVPLFTCFRDPVFAHDMSRQIKELNRRLESVSKRSSMFHFVRASSASPWHWQMKATYIHRVEKLQPQDGWKLLKNQVMLGDDPSDIEFLQDIGMKIVTRCDCLPLAIKTVGGLLCTKDRTPRDWGEVSESAAWSMAGLPDEVHSAIYLSYADLPSQLKQCFLHCSLFPKDEVIKRVDVVQMWIAEGFIQDDGNCTILEDTGSQYYKELIMRNLLDPNDQYYDQSGCTMHDILRSFAHYLAKDEAAVLAQGQSLCNKNAKTKLRRISIASEDVHPSALKDEKQLRALMLFRSTKIELENFLHNLPRLRVLHLGGVNLKTLPPSLCDLRHLRYLELSGTMIDTIPDSVGNLKYLQYIGLINCINLSILPGSIVKLQKLRALHIMGTKVSEIPKGIGRLQNLVELTGFLTQNDDTAGWNSLEELGHLSQLSLLYLNNLEKACSGSISKKAKLQSKLHLRYLSLECTTGPGDGSQVGKITSEKNFQIEDIFEALCPPPCLENLSLVGFFGKQLPNWMSSGQMALKNLRALKLEDSIYCEQLPAFGHLPSLEFFLIKNAPSIMRIGHEFLCTSNGTLMNHQMSLFPRLEKLGFDQLDRWEEWIWNKELKQAMPKILSLKIMKCK